MKKNNKRSENVELAGIGLLAPYISQLFRHLGYTNGYEFKDEKSRLKAYSLLMKLSDDGKCNLLVGYICDLNNHALLVELEEEELEELKKMLNAAVNSWGKLKNISLESFIKYWIRRKGVLIEVENFYKLSVQRETGDILLDFINWDYKNIKFPWMKKPLIVEW